MKPDESPTWARSCYGVGLLVPLLRLGHDEVWYPVGVDKAMAPAVTVAGPVPAATMITGAGRTLGS